MLVSVCRAANVMKSTGHTVTLKVAKRAALHHGLGTLLDQPSPRMQQHSGMEPLSRCLVSLSAERGIFQFQHTTNRTVWLIGI